MSKLLILYLHKTNRVTCVIKNKQGRIIKQYEASDLNEIKQYAKLKSFILVPAEDILLTTISLPKISAHRLKKAIPFAVEEQLIEDINNVHIVSASVHTNDCLPIAVIAKPVLENWLNLLKKYNIFPSILTSIVFAVPLQKIYCFDDTCIIRTDHFAGLSCHVDHLPVLVRDTQIKKITTMEIVNSFSGQEKYINLLQGDYKFKRSKLELFILFLCMLILLSNILSFCIMMNYS